MIVYCLTAINVGNLVVIDKLLSFFRPNKILSKQEGKGGRGTFSFFFNLQKQREKVMVLSNYKKQHKLLSYEE